MKSTLKKKKNPAATSLGKLGAQNGGLARAAKLSAEERRAIAMKGVSARIKKTSAKRRSEIARNASMARWSGKK